MIQTCLVWENNRVAFVRQVSIVYFEIFHHNISTSFGLSLWACNFAAGWTGGYTKAQTDWRQGDVGSPPPRGWLAEDRHGSTRRNSGCWLNISHVEWKRRLWLGQNECPPSDSSHGFFWILPHIMVSLGAPVSGIMESQFLRPYVFEEETENHSVTLKARKTNAQTIFVRDL